MTPYRGAFFGESLGVAQIAGILLMLISFTLATGSIGVMQKVHQSSDFREELYAFLIIAFAVSAALCALSPLY